MFGLESSGSAAEPSRPASLFRTRTQRSNRSHQSIFKEEFNSDLSLPLSSHTHGHHRQVPYHHHNGSSYSSYKPVTAPIPHRPSTDTGGSTLYNDRERERAGDSDQEAMATPTPREVHRLASHHDFIYDTSSKPRRLGWRAFVGRHLSLPAAFITGIIFVIVAIVFTTVTSKRPLECPDWAEDCRTVDRWTTEHLPTIQGVITLVYIIGLGALAYVALALCEAAVWPLLVKQTMTMRGLEAYLATTRGSILAAPRAFMEAKTVAMGVMLVCAVTSVLTPLAGIPLVGQAYTTMSREVELKSNYTPGGGLEESFQQTEAPSFANMGVLTTYNSWAMDPASEPLPEYQDWYVDREVLGTKGNLSARAVKLQTTVSCSPRTVEQLIRSGKPLNAFPTNWTRANISSLRGEKRTPAEVYVRPQPELTGWADNFTFEASHRTKATLVFAALNGTIEGGKESNFTLGTMKSVSAIACEVIISATDDILTIGNPSSRADNTTLPTLSSLETLHTNTSNPSTALNELLLWFTIAPILSAPSVSGAQPMFSNSTSTNRAVAYTGQAAQRNTWTIDGIESFIHLSIGALLQSTTASQAGSTDNTTLLTSTYPLQFLSRLRALLLLLLPLLLVTLIVCLSFYLSHIHARESIPVLRLAGPCELLKSSQTHWLREQAGTDAAKTYLPSDLGATTVRFGAVGKEGAEMVGLGDGNGRKVGSFVKEIPRRVQPLDKGKESGESQKEGNLGETVEMGVIA
ncbi:hypothetical protein SMACR_06084 [Sordaria macrospora]|uniref:WGS project CABT00000000 data, contig 2.32 n=2 Tax=Sordaria macrospora TaxID=5147 RepID=F7W604_SORMK|nr:uncharacterized protein SMAC_06084 [Sordaria macrospora k-hell]KAA8631418.1 hypothetical protein SMACR_06084 [Sordaria macrospora]KAH7628172.1 hypothetical protein B0T09DRAFT_176348 [Sordaria sp. MPI-SDFR-AT-0083]WPJ65627.1 hypothetical protein SMAC4_06084 [Sordaria macrospora]CCC12942.1 unnamed protein product [Sordaria macrospora k-hell]